MYRQFLTLTAVVVATSAFAHTGVKDPQVMARMDGMVVLGDNTKVLSQMARGQIAFDAAKAEAARAALAEEAARVLELFEPEAEDPKSESLPVIWTDWVGFVARADALEAAVAAADVSSAEAIAMSLREIGRTCGACHEGYRE